MKLLSIFSKRRLSEDIWMAGFKSGFTKAWDMMMPLMMDGVSKSKKLIEDKAINETLTRMANGYNKKTH